VIVCRNDGLRIRTYWRFALIKLKDKYSPVCAMKAERGRSIAPLLLHLRTKWTWVVIFPIQPLCSRRDPRYSLARRLGWRQNISESRSWGQTCRNDKATFYTLCTASQPL